MASRKRCNETSMAELSSDLGYYDVNGDNEDMDVDANDEEECILLERLPPELRVLIYNKLEPSELLKLRCTNHQIKNEIDQNLDFDIKLDQTYRFFRRLMKLRIRSCRIRHLTHMNIPQKVFAFPARMKKLIFDGSISPTNVKRILTQCSSVEELMFTHETLGIDQLLTKPCMQTCVRNLQHLTHLSLQLLRHPAMDYPSRPENNIATFLEARFPKLKSLKLYYSVWGRWINLLLFIQRHANTLQDIELHVGDRGDSRNTNANLQKTHPAVLLNAIDMKVLKSLKLREFKFRDDVLHLNRTVKNIVFDVLACQNQLEVLHFHSPGDMDVTVLKNLVLANQSTLREVVVYNLQSVFAGNNNNNNDEEVPDPLEADNDEDEIPIDNAAPLDPDEGLPNPAVVNGLPGVPPQNRARIVLDMSIFSLCQKLTVLALSCSPSNNPNQLDPVPIRLTQINSIPPSVVRLHLTGFIFNRDEMIHLTDYLPNLKEILLSDTGKMRYAMVLSCILRNCQNLEYVSINPVRIGGSTSGIWYNEVEELNKLFQKFLQINYDPIDEMNGFEARITEEDRKWIRENIQIPNSSHPTAAVEI